MGTKLLPGVEVSKHDRHPPRSLPVTLSQGVDSPWDTERRTACIHEHPKSHINTMKLWLGNGARLPLGKRKTVQSTTFSWIHVHSVVDYRTTSWRSRLRDSKGVEWRRRFCQGNSRKPRILIFSRNFLEELVEKFQPISTVILFRFLSIDLLFRE